MSLYRIDEHNDHKEVQRHMYAAMETGNHDEARMILTEYRATHPAQAEALGLAVARDYGIGLK